jgi:RNA polymerase sigma-70 factor, ECF subfamily
VQSTVDHRALPDRELVRLMAARDAGALDRLRARHARIVYPLARGILHDPARADRAVSEAFRDAFHAAHRFVPGEMTVLAWLTGLTRRRALILAARPR